MIIKNNSPQFNFEGKIIDSHVHCGKWINDKFSTEDILAFFDKRLNDGKDKLDRVIISNLDCIINGKNKAPYKNEIQGNLILLRKCLKDNRLLPLVVCQPGVGCADNIELLLKKYPNTRF